MNEPDAMTPLGSSVNLYTLIARINKAHALAYAAEQALGFDGALEMAREAVAAPTEEGIMPPGIDYRWALLARLGGTKPPSEVTIEMVLQILESRIPFHQIKGATNATP